MTFNAWREVFLEDVAAELTVGFVGSMTSEYVDSGIPFLRSKNVEPYGIKWDDMRFISREFHERLKKSALAPGDVVIVRTGKPGAAALIPKSLSEANCSDVVIVRPGSQLDARFLVYYLNSLAVHHINAHLVGAVQQHFNVASARKLRMKLPPLDEQKAIAQILSSLDDKIELNQQMNQTLEAIARAIFKSWFIDFDPVRAKMDGQQPADMDAETAALFPAEFEDSAIGKIPQGWIFEQIRNRASSIQYGLTQSASSEPVGPHFLRITDIRGGFVNWGTVPFCKVSSDEYEKYKIKAGDIFVARTGASTGENIYIVDPPDSVFASYLVRFQFSDLCIARIVGTFMRTETYFDYVAGAIGGSAQPNASAQVLAGASLVFPTKEVADCFHKAIYPSDLLRSKNDEQSRTLASIRDALLPKLLSGKIRIKDAEKFIEEVGQLYINLN